MPPRSRVETLHRGVYLQLLKQGRWEYADRVRGREAVAIVAITDKQELILTEQYRVPLRKQVIDLAAGLVGDVAGDEEEQARIAAERELLEETGYVAKTWEYVFTGPLSAGMTTELVSFFVARSAKQVGPGGGDGTEGIQVHKVPLGKLEVWLRRKGTSRRLIDPKIYAAVGILQLRGLLDIELSAARQK